MSLTKLRLLEEEEREPAFNLKALLSLDLKSQRIVNGETGVTFTPEERAEAIAFVDLTLEVNPPTNDRYRKVFRLCRALAMEAR